MDEEFAKLINKSRQAFGPSREEQVAQYVAALKATRRLGGIAISIVEQLQQQNITPDVTLWKSIRYHGPIFDRPFPYIRERLVSGMEIIREGEVGSGWVIDIMRHFSSGGEPSKSGRFESGSSSASGMALMEDGEVRGFEQGPPDAVATGALGLQNPQTVLESAVTRFYESKLAHFVAKNNLSL
jgi:hypothetical protein